VNIFIDPRRANDAQKTVEIRAKGLIAQPSLDESGGLHMTMRGDRVFFADPFDQACVYEYAVVGLTR